MANDTVFQVIRDAIVNASSEHAPAPKPAREPPRDIDAEHYARAVLIALDHNGFKIIQATEEPDVD